jgi:hypothetical protein
MWNNFDAMVDKWYIFKPKLPLWVNFGGFSCMENVGLGMYFTPFGIFSGHLEYFKVILLSLFWYVTPRKIWQPCSIHKPVATFHFFFY